MEEISVKLERTVNAVLTETVFEIRCYKFANRAIIDASQMMFNDLIYKNKFNDAKLKKVYFIILFITVVGLGCSLSSDGKNNLKESDVITDSLELELTMLRNQAFCDCYYKSMKIANAHISPPDGSNYVQLSSLAEQYANDPKLNMIVDKWVEKEYFSYSKDNKLYLMRCLDFYNSSDLDTYIDSVRKKETKKLLIEFNKKYM